MSVVTLAVVSAPGCGQEATGAGRGGTTETPATAPLYCDTTQRTLHLHFLHCTTDTLCTTEHLHRLEVSLSHKPHSICVGIIGLYVSMTVKV